MVHDLAECVVGDITPRCGVGVEEKHRREDEAMRQLADLAGPCGQELYQLYKVLLAAFKHCYYIIIISQCFLKFTKSSISHPKVYKSCNSM